MRSAGISWAIAVAALIGAARLDLAAAAPPAGTEGSARLGAQVEALCGRVEVACPHLMVAATVTAPIARTADGVTVSADLAALARSPQEERALAAVIVAWSHRRPAPKSPSDLPQQALALATFAAGEALDPLKQKQDRYNRSRNLQYAPPDRSGPPAGIAAEALAYTAAAGSCSGALADLLHRAAEVPVDAPEEQRARAAFALALLRQLGASILPPERRCVPG